MVKEANLNSGILDMAFLLLAMFLCLFIIFTMWVTTPLYWVYDLVVNRYIRKIRP